MQEDFVIYKKYLLLFFQKEKKVLPLQRFQFLSLQ